MEDSVFIRAALFSNDRNYMLKIACTTTLADVKFFTQLQYYIYTHTAFTRPPSPRALPNVVLLSSNLVPSQY